MHCNQGVKHAEELWLVDQDYLTFRFRLVCAFDPYRVQLEASHLCSVDSLVLGQLYVLVGLLATLDRFTLLQDDREIVQRGAARVGVCAGENALAKCLLDRVDNQGIGNRRVGLRGRLDGHRRGLE